MLVIGSYAIKYWLGQSYRDYNDIDIWMNRDQLVEFYQRNYKNIESFVPLSSPNKFRMLIENFKLEIGLYGNNSPNRIIELAQRNKGAFTYIFGFKFKVPTLYTLKLIKRSHLHTPIHWEKHIKDYHTIKRYEPFFYNAKDQDNGMVENAFYMLHKNATDRFNKFKVRLNMSNEDFFNKSQSIINRVYNHDDIHKATCYYNEPLYLKIKYDKSKAKCDFDLWNTLSYVDKIRAVQEEAFVIALERYLIPTPDKYTSKEAFNKAVQKICTTLCSGWFRDFAIENWPEISRCYHDFAALFNEAVANNKVRLYEEQS